MTHFHQKGCENIGDGECCVQFASRRGWQRGARSVGGAHALSDGGAVCGGPLGNREPALPTAPGPASRFSLNRTPPYGGGNGAPGKQHGASAGDSALPLFCCCWRARCLMQLENSVGDILKSNERAISNRNRYIRLHSSCSQNVLFSESFSSCCSYIDLLRVMAKLRKFLFLVNAQ